MPSEHAEPHLDYEYKSPKAANLLEGKSGLAKLSQICNIAVAATMANQPNSDGWDGWDPIRRDRYRAQQDQTTGEIVQCNRCGVLTKASRQMGLYLGIRISVSNPSIFLPPQNILLVCFYNLIFQDLQVYVVLLDQQAMRTHWRLRRLNHHS